MTAKPKRADRLTKNVALGALKKLAIEIFVLGPFCSFSA